jgi:hypothetical protein
MAAVAMSRGGKDYVGVDRLVAGAELSIPGRSIFFLPFSDKTFEILMAATDLPE